MKPLHLLLTVAFLLQGTIASAESADLHDFNVGLAVGNCVAANCEIFRGYVLDDPTEGAEEVTVKVTDWLLGAPLETDTIRVPHDVPAAKVGIEGLTSMANESPQTVLTPGVLDRVRTVYLRLLQGNEVSKSTALESALGLTPNKAK